MMAATHALMGLLLGISSQWVWPELLFYAALGGFIGGVFPDLDLLFNHRRTLHFPVGFPILAIISGTAAFIAPSATTAAAFYFFLSAAVHSLIDVLGGGLETRPWIPSSDRAVYSHTLGKWLSPRRWIRYDGSPEDLILTILLAIPCYLFYTGIIQDAVVITVLLGGIYTALRKKIIDWTPERFL